MSSTNHAIEESCKELRGVDTYVENTRSDEH